MKYEELYKNCQAAFPDYLAMWKKLVNVDCGSRYGKGINQVAEILLAEFKKLDPHEIRLIPMKNPTEGSHLLVTFKGKGKVRILLEAHLDTVFPEGTVAQRPFQIDGDWVRGPGCADCKSGVNMMLFAMKQLEQLGYTDYDTITCFFNGDEEIGSPDSHLLLERLAPAYDVYICCESGQEGDGIVRSRKGTSHIRLKVHGVASHAGSAPEKGCSALMEILHQIQEMKEVEKPELGTTINFTMLQSGTAENIIPDEATAVADVRVTAPEENKRIENAIKAIAMKPIIRGTSVDARFIVGKPPFYANPATDQMIELAEGIYGEIGKTLRIVSAGGASDANWAASYGLVAIDGFGAVKGGKNHTPKECAQVSSVVPRMYLLSRMLLELGKRVELPK